MGPYRTPATDRPRSVRRWGATPRVRFAIRSKRLARKVGRAMLIALVLVVVPPIRLLLGEDPFDF